jgi:hypothetical protein
MNAEKPRIRLTGAPLIGRRIGVAAFWCMAVFVTTASSRSVILELYGSPTISITGAKPDDPRCKDELRALHSELLLHAGALPHTEADETQFRAWLRAWDGRFAVTRDVCAGLLGTRETLQTLRKKLDAKRRDDARELLPLTERIERALSRAVTRSTPSRKT